MSSEVALEVKNLSTQTVKDVTVKACLSNLLVVENLEKGKSKKIVFSVSGECVYEVKVTFADGTTLYEELGYLTHGTEFNDMIIIKNGLIDLKRDTGKIGHDE